MTSEEFKDRHGIKEREDGYLEWRPTADELWEFRVHIHPRDWRWAVEDAQKVFSRQIKPLALWNGIAIFEQAIGEQMRKDQEGALRYMMGLHLEAWEEK